MLLQFNLPRLHFRLGLFLGDFQFKNPVFHLSFGILRIDLFGEGERPFKCRIHPLAVKIILFRLFLLHLFFLPGHSYCRC